MQRKSRNLRRSRAGFTLIEVLLVLVILVTLASLAGFFVFGAQERANVDAARAQIGRFTQVVASYQIDVGRYPSTAGGLNALLTQPSDLPNPERWRGPYLEGNKVPLDPWDMPYQYQLVDSRTFKIWSLGPDGADGTTDDVLPAGQ